MLSDEITTGSITTSDQEKRIYASRSHAWNIQQKKFQEAFPEYSEQTMKDLPNMGEADRGKPSEESEQSSTAASSSSTPVPTPSARFFAVPPARGAPALVVPPASRTNGRLGQEVAPVPILRPPNGANPGRIESWTASLGNKWSVVALVLLAIVVSRSST
ncbi:Ubiquitin-conjugating enzyme E2 6 [Tulasnella sp. 427]|nr:Ubiquitin-conjugating enzyme E2 6 [Tulasnella sp. 427]